MSRIGRSAPDIGLDLVELGDALQRLLGDRSRGTLLRLVHLPVVASRVGHAPCMHDAPAAVESLVARVCVGLQDAAVALEVFARVLAAAVGARPSTRICRGGASNTT